MCIVGAGGHLVRALAQASGAAMTRTILADRNDFLRHGNDAIQREE